MLKIDKTDYFLKALEFVLDRLKNIPELDETIGIIKSNKGIKTDIAKSPLEYINIIFFDYLLIVRALVTLSDEDVGLVSEINRMRKTIGLDSNPLGHHGIDVFYKNVNKIERNNYWSNLVKSLQANNQTFINAVFDLSDRMTLASSLTKAGVVLKDGDPRADKVIWGHTKGLIPEATIHFVVCHLIDRLTFQIFNKSKDEKLRNMVKGKHYLFDPLGDMIFLMTTRNMINPEIAKRWMLKRVDGGLSWNTQEEQDVFDKTCRTK